MTIQTNIMAPVTDDAPPAQYSKNTLVTTDEQQGKPRKRLLAELGFSAIVPNTTTARTFAKATFGELDLTESVAVMREKARAVHSGNLGGLEETLTAQAVALDAIFNEMARRAALNMGEHLTATETYLRLGLKAQAQCRATLQTLFEMKNPQPVAFVKQANIANGPQQVNNGAVTQPPPHAGIPANQSNELLGQAMSNGWTSERRARQATLILNWKQWERSCGPTTERGKVVSSKNARRHGMRSQSVLEETRMLRSLIRQCRGTAEVG